MSGRIPPELLETTMDQLRTLLAVREAGTAREAARLLGRGQASVQKQLDTMNRNLGAVCGEPLVLRRGRGERVHFTATGAALAELARSTLAGWTGELDGRRGPDARLAVGSTRYTLGYLLDAVRRVAGPFQDSGVRLTVAHVRTAELLARLDDRELDLVCGSTLTTGGPDDRLAGYDVLEWRRSGLSLLTNLPPERLPGTTVPAHALPGLPLAVAGSGLIPAFLRGWFGGRYREELWIAAEIDTLPYGLELLTSGVLHGCLPVTRGIAEAVAAGRMGGPAARGLRALAVADGPGPGLQVLAGAFVRRGELAGYGAGRPLDLLWSGLLREHARHRAGRLPARRS
ncbi:LysR family transcriptional regulator [Streptomyces sp. NPDC018031]|uniref:LysR family transcriptional regulator n=1 Tax=Streptomyces sp. NPDC018031 TaxID=3365033 RepID=UPI0037B6141F